MDLTRPFFPRSQKVKYGLFPFLASCSFRIAIQKDFYGVKHNLSNLNFRSSTLSSFRRFAGGVDAFSVIVYGIG